MVLPAPLGPSNPVTSPLRASNEIPCTAFMSPKDLCTINIIDKILKSGVSILKIEGRGRSPEYVSEVVKVYREAINDFSLNKVNGCISRLEKVYNQ